MSVPRLRFKVEDGRAQPDWCENTLLNLSENGFTNGVFNDPNKTGRGYKLVNVLDMYIDSTIDEKRLSLVELSEDEFKKNKVEHGEIFFTRSSLVKEGIACSNVYLGNSRDITFDGHLIRMRPRSNVLNSVFANYLLRTSKVRKQLVARGKTATMTTIGQADIAAVVVAFPSLTEQTKIANFLTAVDERISQLGQKCELLAQFKKGGMQKIFSQEVRFKDDEGREFPGWEEKTIGAILKIGNGKDYRQLSAGTIPVYGTGGYMLSVNEYLYDGESVCIGRKGTIDKPMLLLGKFWTVDTLFYTHSFKGCLPKFIYACFQNIEWKNYNEASGVPSLSKSTIEKIGIKLPSLPEQTKITNFLTAIDDKISNTQAQLEAARQYKQGLLQQMFV